MNQFYEFLDRIKNVGLEWYKRFYSSYPAQVIDNNDPDKLGRIKFKCPSVFGIDFIHPLWADPCDFRLAGKNTGEFFPPYVGDWVEVMFEHGDTNHPIYMGGFYAKKELPSDFSNGYPNVRGWVFKSGQKIVIDESKGKEKITIHNTDGSEMILDGASGSESVNIKHKSGAKMIIDQNGDILFADKSGSDSVAIKDGEVDVISNGKVNVTGKADVAINGQATATLIGKSGTTVGSAASVTKVDGTTVLIAGGGPPAARLGDMSIGIGNLGIPVSSTIIKGSTKTLIG